MKLFGIELKKAMKAPVAVSTARGTGFVQGIGAQGSNFIIDPITLQTIDGASIDAWTTEVVKICISKTAGAFKLAPMIVQSPSSNSSDSTAWKEIPKHPLVDAEQFCNDDYTSSQLWEATITSLFASSEGCAYWHKVRNAGKRVIGFYYLPHMLVEPQSNDTSRLVTHYKYTPPGGTPQTIKAEDIVHFRLGVNIRDMRYGCSPLGLTSVIGDEECSMATYWILKNMGMVPYLVTPKTGDAAPSPGFFDQIRDFFKRVGTGEARGQVPALGTSVDVHKLGMSPDEMAVDKVWNQFTTRICAAFGMDPMVAGFASESKTYSNYQEAIKAFYQGTIAQLQKDLGKQLMRQCLGPDFGQPENRVSWDESEVWFLKEDFNRKLESLSKAFMANAIKRSVLLASMSYESGPEDEVYYSESTAGGNEALAKSAGRLQKMVAMRAEWERNQEQYADPA
jgi:HK97 family phage portal protein